MNINVYYWNKYNNENIQWLMCIIILLYYNINIK